MSLPTNLRLIRLGAAVAGYGGFVSAGQGFLGIKSLGDAPEITEASILKMGDTVALDDPIALMGKDEDEETTILPEPQDDDDGKPTKGADDKKAKKKPSGDNEDEEAEDDEDDEDEEAEDDEDEETEAYEDEDDEDDLGFYTEEDGYGAVKSSGGKGLSYGDEVSDDDLYDEVDYEDDDEDDEDDEGERDFRTKKQEEDEDTGKKLNLKEKVVDKKNDEKTEKKTNIIAESKSKNKVTVRPGGVLATTPGAQDVITDPAGLPYIKGQAKPSRAEAASKAIYQWLGLKDAFPTPVSNAISQETDAKYHEYDNQSKFVVHAVGPDFRNRKTQELTKGQMHPTDYKNLVRTYSNILNEFGKSKKTNLRLLPVSSGVFGGAYSGTDRDDTLYDADFFPTKTAEAVKEALKNSKLGPKQTVEMYIFINAELPLYQNAFGSN